MRQLFTLFFSCSILFIFGQKATVFGQIKGNGDELPSALVVLDNSSVTNVLTEMNGNFQFVDIPYGKHTLTVRYIGFQTLTQEINVNVKELNLGILELKDNTKNLSEVEIKAELKKGSENKAIALTKESKKIVTIVSAETIKKLPDRNAAEAVKRVAGAAVQNNKGEGSQISLRGTPVDWTSTLVNGDRLPVADEENQSRSFEFEVMPADLVDYIVVARSATPDLEADNVGGTINFLTKSSVDKRTLTINVGTGANFLAKKPLGYFNILCGDRSKNNKFGYIINASYYGRYYAADAQKFLYGNNYNHAINRYELKQYTGSRQTVGVNAAFDYQINRKVKIGGKFLQGAMFDDKWQNKMAYTYMSGDNATFKEQFIHGKLNRTLYGGELNTEIKAGDKVKINVRAATYYNKFGYGNVPFKKNGDPRNGYFTAEFSAVNTPVTYADKVGISWTGQAAAPGSPNFWDGVKLLDIDNPYGTGDHYTNVKPQIISAPVADSTMKFYRAFSETNITQEQDPYVIQTDITYQVRNNVRLQFGTKHRMKTGSRTLGYYEWQISKQTGNSTTGEQDLHGYLLSEFATQPNTFGNFLTEYGSPYGNIPLSVMTHNQLNNLFNVFQARSPNPMVEYNGKDPKSYSEEKLWTGSTYWYKEYQNGAYAMVNANLGQLDIVGGLRAEYTIISESAYDKDTTQSLLYYDSLTHGIMQYNPNMAVSVSQKYWSFLPSLNLTYHVREDMNVRVAGSRTFHRQNFQELKPGAALINYSDFLYIKGNPNLKPAYAYNVDLMYELFWGNKGMFSVGAYYKYITDHIFEVATADVDPLSGFMIRTYKNAGKSWIFGAEANISRKFDFLPGALGGFGVSANVTYSLSRMHVPGRPNAQAMAEQTPLLFNAAVFYEKYNVSARVAFNYTGAYLKSLNLATDPNTGELLHKGSDFDLFQAPIYSLDFQVGYTFKDRYTVMVDATNLLDCPFKEYIGNPNRPIRVEYYKQRFSVGFKFDL